MNYNTSSKHMRVNYEQCSMMFTRLIEIRIYLIFEKNYFVYDIHILPPKAKTHLHLV